MVVFYGSQTGTAEELASRLAKDAARFGLKGFAVDPEECDMVRLLTSATRLLSQVPWRPAHVLHFRTSFRSCRR